MSKNGRKLDDAGKVSDAFATSAVYSLKSSEAGQGWQVGDAQTTIDGKVMEGGEAGQWCQARDASQVVAV